MNDDLKNAMRIIDKISDKIPEGDYLDLCNIMRDLYNRDDYDTELTVNARSLFPEPIFIDDIYLDDESISHFQTVYENSMRYVDVQAKENEIKMIDKMIKRIKLLHRMTPSVVRQAIRHYYESHGIYIYDYTPEMFESLVGDKHELRTICLGYMNTENTYRNTLIRNLQRRCAHITQEIDMVRQGFI